MINGTYMNRNEYYNSMGLKALALKYKHYLGIIYNPILEPKIDEIIDTLLKHDINVVKLPDKHLKDLDHYWVIDLRNESIKPTLKLEC